MKRTLTLLTSFLAINALKKFAEGEICNNLEAKKGTPPSFLHPHGLGRTFEVPLALEKNTRTSEGKTY